MIDYTPQEQVVVELFRARRWVSYEQLENALWGLDPNGGPENSRDAIRVYIYKLRSRGFRIYNNWGRGYKLISDPEEIMVEGVRWMEYLPYDNQALQDKDTVTVEDT